MRNKAMSIKQPIQQAVKIKKCNRDVLYMSMKRVLNVETARLCVQLAGRVCVR